MLRHLRNTHSNENGVPRPFGAELGPRPFGAEWGPPPFWGRGNGQGEDTSHVLKKLLNDALFVVISSFCKKQITKQSC